MDELVLDVGSCWIWVLVKVQRPSALHPGALDPEEPSFITGCPGHGPAGLSLWTGTDTPPRSKNRCICCHGDFRAVLSIKKKERLLLI